MSENEIDKIYDEYFSKVYFYVKRILGNLGTNEDVEECVSDVFLALWKDYHKYDKERGTLNTYINVKTRTIALNFRKKLSNYGGEYKIDPIEDKDIPEKITMNTEEIVMDKIEEKRILRIIEMFNEPNKSYFYLRYFKNYDIKTIAKMYNTTISSVDNRLYRCRLALKKTLGKEIV